jgi:hypothetical protein
MNGPQNSRTGGFVSFVGCGVGNIPTKFEPIDLGDLLYEQDRTHHLLSHEIGIDAIVPFGENRELRRTPSSRASNTLARPASGAEDDKPMHPKTEFTLRLQRGRNDCTDGEPAIFATSSLVLNSPFDLAL